MPGAKDISGIYKQHQKRFLKFLKAAKTLDEEAIHQLRVETKKLRSLFRFLDFLLDDGFKQKKIEGLISPVYKSAGKYRAAGLNHQLLDEQLPKAVPEFERYLEEKISLAGKKFLKVRKNVDKQKFKEYSEKPLCLFKKESNATVLKTSRAYVDGIFSDIGLLLTKAGSDENFHEVRKKLKDAKTIMGLIRELHPDKKAQPLENVKELEEDIGKWHDRFVLAEELDKFAAQSRDKNRLRALVAKLRAGNKHNRIQLTRQVRQFISGKPFRQKNSK